MNEAQPGNRKILIAEDDPVSRRVLEVLLAKWGYQVIAAENGADALSILQSGDSPRMAVLDWMMPGLEGVEVCRRLRRQSAQPYIYVLLLTARSDREDLLAALHAGADDYLTKPFDARELRARLIVGRRIVDLQDQLIGAREELRFRATHDALTGIFNRAEILDALSREAVRQAREHGSFAIALVDLDHFKIVNDTYGHAAGDFVLREAARRMASCIRPYDMLGRYGGEEFLVVIPSTDVSGALCLAERIRAAVSKEPIASPNGPVQLTASLGVAISSGEYSQSEDDLIQSADKALYIAKEKGRNRAEMAPFSSPLLSHEP
ncbi:MAG TPA: diguanylate cyclase [Verrucomicrobiae bacterium]|nr:diguanylate cyclase [Verrucomicrobiae bacterium]